MRDALAKLLPSLTTVATPKPPPPQRVEPTLGDRQPTNTDPEVIRMLLEIQRRVVRIETRQAKFMQAQGVDLGNYTR